MKILREFKEFAVRGNAVDMAVGITVGAAFTAIVNSFVKDIFTPPLGLITGSVDFQEKLITIREATPAREAITITYGAFISQFLDFILIALAVFFLVRFINRWRASHEEPKESTTKKCRFCFSAIHVDATKCPQCTSDNP